jgi:RNA polymerase sigma-70 factor (ECF subfamily)
MEKIWLVGCWRLQDTEEAGSNSIGAPFQGISRMAQWDTREQMIALLPRLKRFAMVLTRSADAADDLVQSAVERALSRLDQWQPYTQLDRWMFRIMKTVWINSRRSAAIRSTEPIDEHTDAAIVDGVREAEAKISLAQVRHAFTRLSPEQQQAILLVSVEGYTYNEAADLLGVPIGTVISRLARGRAILMATAAAPAATASTIHSLPERGTRR